MPARLNASRGVGQTCIRVLSVDRHPLLREGIAAIINHQPDMALVSQASGGREAIRRYREHRPDVTIMDVWLHDLGGIDALTAIRGEFPAARIIMLSSLEGDVEVRRALEAGARGYLLKNMPPFELIRAIREVHAGRKSVPPEVAAQLAEHVGDDNLTAREIEVLARLCDGNRNRDIGELLCISEDTVKVHMKGIRQKLGAKDRTEAMTIAARRGIIRL
jgi:DNA-binding NarL/FixJ family response regulator